MKTGYIHVEPQLGNYIHGDGKLGTFPLQPDGQWDAFLPEPHQQDENGFEPFCCVSEATITCISILAKQAYQNTIKRSVRFLAAVSGTGAKQGNDPNTVCQSFKDSGTVYETDYPFTAPDYDTFYQKLTRALKTLALGESAEWAYGHSWCTDTSQQGLMDALPFSPLSAAGYAWELNPQTGYYISPKGTVPQHDFTIYGYVRNNYWKVRDSYPPFDKKLSWDFNFTGVKRHTIKRQIATTPESESAWTSFLKWFQSVINDLRFGSFGGISRSPVWGRVRKDFITKNPECAVCSTTKKCEVHHQKPYHMHPELELLFENLITLCRDHHYLFGHLLNWSSYDPDVSVNARVMHDRILSRP